MLLHDDFGLMVIDKLKELICLMRDFTEVEMIYSIGTYKVGLLIQLYC